MRLQDLQEYKRMSAAERNGERGKAIRAELETLLPWMPYRFRRVVSCRYIRDMSLIATAMEIHCHPNTVKKWTKQISAWLKDKDEYLRRDT